MFVQKKILENAVLHLHTLKLRFTYCPRKRHQTIHSEKRGLEISHNSTFIPVFTIEALSFWRIHVQRVCVYFRFTHKASQFFLQLLGNVVFHLN